MFDLDKSFKKGLLSSKPVLIIFIVLFIVVVLQYVFFKKIVIDVKLTAKRHIENTQSELGNGDKEEDNNSNKWYRKIDNINTVDGINTIEQLKAWLELTMPEGYSWDDFINGKLHIDHIIPVKLFNFERYDHIDFKRCWALDNLQLLTAMENNKKRARLGSSFQPSLML